eukprot:scaffold8605_cov100-Isochrysis_galbana.AAC.1
MQWRADQGRVMHKPVGPCKLSSHRLGPPAPRRIRAPHTACRYWGYFEFFCSMLYQKNLKFSAVHTPESSHPRDRPRGPRS